MREVIHAQAHRRMFIVRIDDLLPMLRPLGAQHLQQPRRMRTLGGRIPLRARQQCVALAQESAQQRVDQPGRTRLPQQPGCVNRRGHDDLGRIARVFELVQRHREQRAQRRREPLAGDQRRHDRLEPPVPAQRPEGDGADCRALLGRCGGVLQRVIGRASREGHRGKRARCPGEHARGRIRSRRLHPKLDPARACPLANSRAVTMRRPASCSLASASWPWPHWTRSCSCSRPRISPGRPHRGPRAWPTPGCLPDTCLPDAQLLLRASVSRQPAMD